MTLQGYHLEFRNQLRELYSRTEADRIADLVFIHFLGLGPTDRIMRQDQGIPETDSLLLDKVLAELLRYKPVQYVTGIAWFRGLPLQVNEQVLIPRPETEELADWVIRDLHQDYPDGLTIADLGTGSGCLAIALKKGFPESRVSALDISSEALSVARGNARDHRTEIDFYQGNLLDPTSYDRIPHADILISNPPYITTEEKSGILPNVLEYEPHLALFVPGEDPLLFYRAILSVAGIRLKNGGRVFVEINESYAGEITALFHAHDYSTELRKDMQEKYRMVKAWKKNAP